MLSHYSPIHRFYTLLSVVVLCLCSTDSKAREVELLLSSKAIYFQRTANIFTTLVISAHKDLKVTKLQLTDNTAPAPKANTLQIAIGSRACNAALATDSTSPLICAFVPHELYQMISSRATRPNSAIYLDYSPKTYLQLIQALLPDAKSIAAVSHKQQQAFNNEFKATAAEMGFTVHHSELTEESNPLELLSPLFEKGDVFLVIPHKISTSRKLAKWKLYLSIKNRVPIIAYSKAYVQAGALAALYCSPGNVATDLMLELDYWLENGSLREPRFAKYFSVNFNTSVARHLGIKLPDEDEIERQLRESFDGF